MAHFGVSSRTGTTPIERGGWLDALRFIMAFLMILHHYRFASPIPLATINQVFDRGYLLTDFFLIDSGYVLARVYAHRVASGEMSLSTFMRKRALRVVPAHLVMSLALAGIVGAGVVAGIAPRHPEWFDWAQLPAQFFLLQAYGVPGGAGWNAPSWTLSALLGCYLCFPLIAGRMTRISPWLALGLAGVFFAACNIATWKILGLGVYGLPFKYGIVRALPLFVVGMALARVGETFQLRPGAARAIGLASIAGLVLTQTFGDFSLVSLGLIAALIIAAGAIPVTRKSWLIEKAAIVSFSMYITNEVFRIGYFGVLNLIEAQITVPEPAKWALWACGVMGALAAAFAFHYVVDMPSQNWVRPWTNARRRRPVASLGSVATT